MTIPNIEASGNLADLLLSLEKQLMDSDFRKDREQVSALLAEDFREFGSSGRVWSRATILDLLVSEKTYTAPAIEDFAIRSIGPETLLVTYGTLRATTESGTSQASLRCSIWVLRENRWQIIFHQGTKIPDA
jgi:hypothetical protein